MLSVLFHFNGKISDSLENVVAASFKFAIIVITRYVFSSHIENKVLVQTLFTKRMDFRDSLYAMLTHTHNEGRFLQE